MAATRRVDEEYMSDSSRIPQGMEISDSPFGNYSYGLEFAKEVGLNSSRFASYQWSWYVQDAFIYKEWSRKIWSDFVALLNCSLAGEKDDVYTEQKANDWTIIITVVAVRRFCSCIFLLQQEEVRFLFLFEFRLFRPISSGLYYKSKSKKSQLIS